ncbi:hypothetical protein BST83_13290 [Polaribacter filamentus]|uniref:Methyltransferase n=1 Tax=Polaribacter filamentus TaxID=53483 RepID=A0A2S7KZV2_9FLAO|nr:DNA modification methylase [Polaribacter filamentus]PQB08018.1 hypothetical protein BST83_13290 [Polaribacter filamentus]
MKNDSQPLEWTTQKMKVNELIPCEYNPRKITPERLEKLKKSIEKYNVAEIPAVNKDRIIIAGHQRIKALIDLGRGEDIIDVRLPNRQLTKEEFKEYNIISNVPVGFWDIEKLDEAFDDIDLLSLGLDIENYELPADVQEMPKILEAVEDDYQEPENLKIDVIEGDIITFTKDNLEHRLLCGSSTEVDSWSKLLDGKEIDLVNTDPPYNVNYEGKTKAKLKIQNDKMDNDSFYQFLYDFFTAIGSFTKPGGGFYVWFATSETINFMKAMIAAGILYKQTLIWKKNSLVMSRQDYHWIHEPCLYGWKPGAAHNWYTDRKQTTVLEFDRPFRNAEHPTMKPIPLISYQINNSSKIGDIVADGFGGSGSTMVASHQLERNAYLIELEPRYCQVTIDRMFKLDNSIQIKINGKSYIPDID